MRRRVPISLTPAHCLSVRRVFPIGFAGSRHREHRVTCLRIRSPWQGGRAVCRAGVWHQSGPIAGTSARGRKERTLQKLLSSTSALLWGLQFAILNPALALLLVTLFSATPADVGGVLAVYNAGGFAAALALPAWADRRRDYVRPMLGCGILTVLLAVALLLTTALPIAVVALVVLGGPAGVGLTLLFAELRHAGVSTAQVMNTRAVYSFAWVAGPPFATLVMGAFGARLILWVLAAVGALNVVTAAAMAWRARTGRTDPGAPGGSTDPGMSAPTADPGRSAPSADPGLSAPSADAGLPDRRSDDIEPDRRVAVRRGAIVALVAAFALLQATNSAAVSMMSLFVSAHLGLPVIWAGIALGAAALLEIPALWVLGRVSGRFTTAALILSGCAAGVLYYAGLAVVPGPALLIAMQPLNAWFYAVLAGTGMTLFQQIIARPGLATGLFMNTGRIGSVAAGGIIAIAGIPALGYPGLFATCALLTALALAIVELTRRNSRRRPESADGAA